MHRLSHAGRFGDTVRLTFIPTKAHSLIAFQLHKDAIRNGRIFFMSHRLSLGVEKHRGPRCEIRYGTRPWHGSYPLQAPGQLGHILIQAARH
jgi:hypothetical protein